MSNRFTRKSKQQRAREVLARLSKRERAQVRFYKRMAHSRSAETRQRGIQGIARIVAATR